MSKPVVAAKKPVVLDLEAGTYYWCQCGLSKKQPYCDGTHKGSDFSPLKFTLEESKKVALCMCKATCDSPYCDGTHSKLS